MKTLKEKTATGILWGAMNNGSMQVLGALFGIITARLLSPKDYALVGMLAIFPAVAGAIQESGFPFSGFSVQRNPFSFSYVQ